jgi:hypothetical protein
MLKGKEHCPVLCHTALLQTSIPYSTVLYYLDFFLHSVWKILSKLLVKEYEFPYGK